MKKILIVDDDPDIVRLLSRGPARSRLHAPHGRFGH